MCVRVRHLLVTVFLLTFLALAAGTPASARGTALETRSGCWASGSLAESLGAVARAAARWHCDGRSFSIENQRVMLRFELAEGGAPPRYLLTRRAALERVHVLTLDADGGTRETAIEPGAWQNSKADGQFRIILPEITAETRQLIVAFDRPSHRMTLERAYLAATDPADGADHLRKLLLLAALCGMLAMPLMFNAAFYRVLREPFVLWHSALAVTLLATVVVSSGLAAALVDVPVMTLSWMATLVFGLSVAAGAMFTYGFIEPGRMHPWLRRALPWCALSAAALSGFHAAFPFVARPVQSTLYTAAFAPILLIFVCAMVDALLRGSRAAKFQAVGWAPMVLVGLTRLITGLVPALDNHDAMMLFYFGCVFEVLSTAMGVADRFMALKDQRDRARTEAALLERLAERDALTGLLNRRAIETHFQTLYASGFTSMAMLDLDHFKAINDDYGHGVGDMVLKAAAEALQPSHDVQAFRMGGEEFLLLVRGKDAHAQAERRRRAIETVVARRVPIITRRVTASLGVVDLVAVAGAAARVDFDRAFERADKLLYDAKLAGRDRGVSADGALRIAA